MARSFGVLGGIDRKPFNTVGLKPTLKLPGKRQNLRAVVVRAGTPIPPDYGRRHDGTEAFGRGRLREQRSRTPRPRTPRPASATIRRTTSHPGCSCPTRTSKSPGSV